MVRGYHCPPVQQPYWNTIDLARFPGQELPHLIDHAYETVVAKLPKKQRLEIAEWSVEVSCIPTPISNLTPESE